MSSIDTHHPDAKNSTKKCDINTQNRYFEHVMCFGTFDLFHLGHIFYLSEAAKHAKKMTIIIARDYRVLSGKGRDPIHNETERLKNVQKSFPDATVILGNETDIFAPIREIQPDILAFGYDQKVPEGTLRGLFPDIEIVRIGGYETDKWKSSILRQGRENITK